MTKSRQMTYWQFHLFFNLPALLVLLWLVRGRLCRAHVVVIAAVAAIAFLATTPWDNLAVHKGIWGFDWTRATPVEIALGGVVWRLPLEEYAFFVIETILVGLCTVYFLPRPSREPDDGGGGGN